MSTEVRHRDIAALLARGVIRARNQPLVAKALESRMPAAREASSLGPKPVNHHSQAPLDPAQDGGDQ